ncbi:NXPE family member 1-like [Lissotriton helveticus]
MYTPMTGNLKKGVFLAVSAVLILYFSIHRKLLQVPTLSHFCQRTSVSEPLLEKMKDNLEDKSMFTLMNFPKVPMRAVNESERRAPSNDVDLQVKTIMRKIDQRITKVSFTHPDNTTCAAKSKVSIINPRERYCVGDNVTIQIDVFDYLGNRKKYGGDFLRARIYSPDLKAGASGKIVDFHNGTYHVKFILFWEGKVKVSLFVIHSSEAVAALWRGRNTGYNYIDHKVRYTNATHEVEAICSYDLDTEEEVCNLMEALDEYPFYCIRPAHMFCSSITKMTSYYTGRSYFTELERPLFAKSRIRAVIPHDLQDLIVLKCSNKSEAVKPKCQTGMKPQWPGGYFHQDLWYPASCSLSRFNTQDEVNSCLKGRYLHLIGDSTMVQWYVYLTGLLKDLKDLELYGDGWHRTRLKVDTSRNIQIKFQVHGLPFLYLSFYRCVGDKTLPEQVDHIGGNRNTVLTLTLGAHFRSFPLHVFIVRAISVRKTIQRLLRRSPETKIVLKTENTSKEPAYFEPMNDFNGYIQHQILNLLLRDLDIGIVDAWDMTVAAAINDMHPPPMVIQNEINYFLTYIC